VSGQVKLSVPLSRLELGKRASRVMTEGGGGGEIEGLQEDVH